MCFPDSNVYADIFTERRVLLTISQMQFWFGIGFLRFLENGVL